MSSDLRSRIAELQRPSPEFPRSFVPVNLDPGDWNQLEPLYQELLKRPLNSAAELEKWLLDQNELGSVIGEEGSRRYVAMTCATDNPEAEAAFLHFVENIDPRLKPLEFELTVRLLECPFTSELEAHRYEVLLRNARNQRELFRPENVPLETETEKLSQQYQKLMGAMMVHFRGEERTMQQMSVFQESNDRSLREEAFRAASGRRLQDTQAVDDIFDKMLELRFQIARNAGFDNFRDYQFRRYNRFDYTPQDCINFHRTVEELIVPLTREILSGRRKCLNINTVRPWDTACDQYGREPLKPFQDSSVLAEKCLRIFSTLDSELGGWFQRMVDLGLLDLGSRKGKAPGGYQTTLTELRLPFIFMNAVGLNRDVETLLHESGHAFHTFSTRYETIAGYRHSPMEFAEVASMSLELLGAPYLEEFYTPGDAARSRRDHLESIIMLMPWIAVIDAFQHWIYTHPEADRKERSDYWVDIWSRFGPGVDYSGLEDVYRYRWHAQLHIFEYPFYYIEYGIAQLGALQIWRNSLRDPRSAVAAYKRALGMGGSRPLPELFTAADARFDFTAAAIKPLVSVVQEAMAREAKAETK